MENNLSSSFNHFSESINKLNMIDDDFIDSLVLTPTFNRNSKKMKISSTINKHISTPTFNRNPKTPSLNGVSKKININLDNTNKSSLMNFEDSSKSLAGSIIKTPGFSDLRKEFPSNSYKDLRSSIDPFIVDEVSRLQKENIIGNDSQEKLYLLLDNEKVKTSFSVEKFTKKMNSVYYQNINNIKKSSCSDNASLIFHKVFSNKRKREEVKVYFDNKQENLGEGSFGVVRKIVHVGSNRKKVIKESVSSTRKTPNKELKAEEKSLKILHEALPIDENLGCKGNKYKHLGLQDAFEGSGKNEGKQFLIGTCYEGDGKSLVVKGTREALVVSFQLLFGLRVLDNAKRFTHDIKDANTLYVREMNFCLPIRIGLSDINSLHYEEILHLYQTNDISLDYPFETYTKKYMPQGDVGAIKKLLAQLKNHEPETKKFKSIVNEIMVIRQKNMVSLTAQAIYCILTGEHHSEFIRTDVKEENEFEKNLIKSLENAIYDKKKYPNTSLCEAIKDIICKMTNQDYKKRPDPKEALSNLLEVIKKYDVELYNLIVEKHWTDGYADWKIDL